jgi:cytoskeletal protein CcmA (bactofilin family)
MFSRASSNKQPSAVPATGIAETARVRQVPSIIAPDMTVVGNIRCDGEVQIDGALQGDIIAEVLTVGENATVRGEVTADTVRVCGVVHGRISAREVFLLKTARMIGDVHHESLSIEAGAQIEGNCRRLEPAVVTPSLVAAETHWDSEPRELAAGE